MARVLIVEDSRSDAVLLETIVRRRGDEAVVLPDGLGVVEHARETKPDVVLMDVVMGGKDGFATCRHMKQDAATKDIPVVLVSARASENDLYWGKRNGAVAYVCKPFTPAQINEAMDFALAAPGSSDPPWQSWSIDIEKRKP